MLSLLCLCLMLVTAQGRKFHEQLDKEDLLYYFGVSEQHQVSSYMFIDEPTISSSKRKEGGDDMFFSLTAFGESFVFELRVNEKILTQDCVLQHFSNNVVISSSPCTDHYRPCTYHGQPLTHVDRGHTWAAVSYCDLLVAVISTSSHDLTILPLKTNQLELLQSLNLTIPFGRPYIVNRLTRKMSAVPKNSTRTRHDTLATVEIVTNEPEVHYHENDNSLHTLNLTSFLTTNINIVFSLFHDETLTYHLSPTISRITIVNTTQFLGDTTNKNNLLSKFADWYTNTSPPYRADLAILVTKQKLDRHNKETVEYDVNGLAYLSGMCHDTASKCIMVKDIGLGTAFTMAHEIGHTLKMSHDNDFAKCKDSGNIMQRFATYGQSSFHWSSCSDEAMRNFLESDDSKCLRNRTRPPINTTLGLLPGILYDEEAQCRMVFGKNFWPNKYRRNKCDKLSCCYAERRCIDIGYPLVDGTECGFGQRKWCIEGRCVAMGPNGPPPISGGWSPWQAWSICSRSAGGGVRFRNRNCNNPKPRFNGQTCTGNESEVKLCNVQPYGLSDTKYKAQQRTQQQTYISRSECHMKRTLDNITTWIPYTDGTNCRNKNPNHISKCYQGACEIFGCDGVLNSSFVFDECGVCNGNGAQCRSVTQKFDIWSLQDTTLSIQIPTNSTGITIRNDSPGVVKLTSDQIAVGVYFYDQFDIVFKRYTNAEEIQIAGPAKQDIEFKVEIIIQHAQQLYDLNIDYTYHTPLASSHPQRYQWTSTWSPCSVTCGTGSRSLIHMCMDTQLHREVHNIRCNIREYPADNRASCTQKTCDVGWYTSNWTACSTTCGEGISTRQVACINKTECQSNTCAPRPLHECPKQTKPNDTMICHQQACRPFWRTTHQSACSQVCGIGVLTRTAMCVDGTNSSLELDDLYCQPEDKPTKSSLCFNEHCYYINEKECKDSDVCDFFNVRYCDHEYLRQRCPKKCKVCGCIDRHRQQCKEITSDSCAIFSEWAKINCAKTCGFCS